MSKSTPEIPDQQTQKASKASSTNNDAAIGDLLRALLPLVEFHKEVEDASVNDLRIFWDVRVIRGASETFMTSSGSSSLPDALSTKLRPGAAGMIQQEVHDKIAVPLVGKMQAFVETGALDVAKAMRKVKPTTREPEPPALLAPGDLVNQANSYEDV